MNVRPAGYYGGAFDVGAEVAKEPQRDEAEEDAGQVEKAAARPEDLAKFLGAAIEHFEQKFAITAEAKLEALRQVVEGLEASHRS